MKYFLPVTLCLAVFTALFFLVRYNRDNAVMAAESSTEMRSDEENWREAAEFEYKITRDVSLGYVPKDRLLLASEELRQGRFARKDDASRTEALTWTERGPLFDSQGPNGNPRPPGVSVAGRVDALCIDRTDPSGHTVWAGSHSGGIWKTNDISAASPVWIQVYDMMANLVIGSICQDPVNTDIFYAGTGDKTELSRFRGGGIWKSTDHGVTWNLLPSATGFWNICEVICDASGNVYMAANDNNAGIRRSSDGGITWTNITPAGLSTRISDMDLSSNGTLHVYCGFRQGSTANCGYRYTPSPATVTSASGWIAPVTPFPLTRTSVQMTVSGNNLFAAPADDLDPDFDVNQFYRSTDGGANWLPITLTPDQNQYDFQAAAINPANPNQIITGSINGFMTNDGGVTWTQAGDGASTVNGFYVHHDYHAVLWQGNNVVMATDGGVYFSSDNGASFHSKNAGMRTFEFYSCALHPLLPDYLIGGTQDNGVERFTQPGLTDGLHVIGGDGGYIHIDQDEPDYQLASTTRNNYRRSVNGGLNWTTVDFAFTGQFINPTDYDDAENKMYAAASIDEYLRWENPKTGNTFTTVAVPLFGGSRISSLVLSPYTPHRMFAALENGKIFRLDDIQTNSPAVTDISGAGRPASYVSCINTGTDENNLITTYSNYGTQHVWITANGGTSWINVSGNLPDIPVRWGIFHPDDNDRAIIATDLGIWTTDDLNGAATVWMPETSLPSVRCSMLQYRPNDRTLAVATYGRGLWTTTLPPLKPFIRFASPNTLNCTEEGLQTSGCRRYKDYTVTLNIDMPPTGAAIVDLSLNGGATAAPGSDFDFTTNGNFTTPSSQLVFPSGSSAPQAFTLRIYDDASVEGPESVIFSYSISGATNALPAAANQQYTVIITDNDVQPVAPSALTNTIGNNNFSSTFQPFRGSFQKSRTQFIYLASELSAAGFIAGPLSSIGFDVTSKQSTIPFTGLTISLKNTGSTGFPTALFETGTTLCYTGDYSTVPGMNTFTFATPFNWDGISNLLVEMCYDNAATSNDDIIKGSLTATCMTTWRRTNTGTGCSLSAVNQTFGSFFARPDITINGVTGKAIETIQGNNVTEYAAGAGTHYFYTNGNGNIISNLSNLSANLGCATTNVFEAGNTWQSFSTGLRSQKVVEVTPSQNMGASYTIGLYYTAAELAGFTPTQLRLAKTTATTMAAANAGNTIISPTTVTPYGSGYLFTASFAGFSKFFLVNQQVALPLTLLSFSGTAMQNNVLLSWTTSSEQNTSHFEIQRSVNGNDFVTTGTVQAAGNSSSVRQYNFTDTHPGEVNYYRLKMVDIDGRFEYSQVIIIRLQATEQKIWVTNPFSNQIRIRFANIPQKKITLRLENAAGQLMYMREVSPAGEIIIDLPGKELNKGIYFLRIAADDKRYLKKLIRE